MPLPTICIRTSSARAMPPGSRTALQIRPASASSTIMRTSPRWPPSTGWTDPVLGLARRRRGSGQRWRAHGAASCCASTARVANAWDIWCRCAFPGATLPRASRGAWRRRRSRCAAATARSRSRFADEPAAPRSRRMLARGLNAPETTSLGRDFRRRRGPARGQAPHARSRARQRCCSRVWPRGTARSKPMPHCSRSRRATTSTSKPLLSRLADEPDAGFGAALFHATLVAALAAWVARAAQAQGIANVACGGGCFLNAILADGIALGARRARHRDAGSHGRAAQRRRPEPGPGVGRAADGGGEELKHVPRDSGAGRRAARSRTRR